MSGIYLDEIGEGLPIVFVHGGGMAGMLAWQAQIPLAARWRLVMLYRLGYGRSPRAPREDFELDALYILRGEPGPHSRLLTELVKERR